MRSLWSGLSLAWMCLSASGAQAVGLLVIERSVVGSAFVEAAEVFQASDQVGITSQQGGAFVEAAVGGTGAGDVVNVFVEATQDSALVIGPDGFRLEGGGAVGAGFDVNDAGFASRAQGSADSVLSLIFEVTAPAPFSLAVSLSASLARLEILSGLGPVESDLWAFGRLRGLSSGTLLDFQVTDQLADDVAVIEQRVLGGVLAVDTYSLELGALIFMRGFEDAVGLGDAGFGFDFVVAPEPGSGLLLLLGLALLATDRRSARA